VISYDGTEAVILYAVDNFAEKFEIKKLNLTSLIWTEQTVQYNELIVRSGVSTWPGYPQASRTLNGIHTYTYTCLVCV
jgi:hypothetical protein